MVNSYIGEISALFVSVCWAISSTFFERSGNRVGSLSVNYIRLAFGFIMLGIFGLLVHGSFFPTGAAKQQWIWLSISGFFGFFIGDLCLFKSFTVIGARLSMLVMTLSPALTALIGFFALNEKLTLLQVLAISLTISGIMMTFLGRTGGHFTIKMSVKGFLLALGGSLGQALGLIFSKKGLGDYDPFAATQIRIITGFISFTLLILFLNRIKEVKNTFSDKPAIKEITIGSFFGPGLGVGLSMFAITQTETGVASALMALTPIVLIVPAVIKGKRIAVKELIGAFVSVGGVVLLFI